MKQKQLHIFSEGEYMDDPDCIFEIDKDVFYQLKSDTIPQNFIRSASIHIPKNFELYNFENLPSFLHYRPLPPSETPIKVNCQSGDIPRCQRCQSYLSPFVKINKERHAWRCPMCGTINSTIHFTPIFDMNIDKQDRLELHHLVYDIIAPEKYLERNGQSRCFLFVIEENLIISKSKLYSQMMTMLENASTHFKEGDKIGLISFSMSVTLHYLDSSKAESFPEFDTELVPKLPNLVDAIKYTSNFLTSVKSRQNTNKNDNSSVFTALQWALHVLKGYGGRIFLFSSGRSTESFIDLQNLFETTSASLSIFEQIPNTQLGSLALNTGGYVSHLFDEALLISLLNVKTAWDCSTVFRYDERICKCGTLLGGFLANNTTIRHPVIDESMSVTIPLCFKKGTEGDFTFQFATRFTSDDGKRVIRIVNGMMPVTDFVPMPYDISAIALYLLRLRARGVLTEKEFINRVVMIRNNSSIPISFLLYSGMTSDRSMICSSSVERFAMTCLITKLIIKGQTFSVLWTTKKIVVFPKPDESYTHYFKEISEKYGLITSSLYSPSNEEEFNSILRSQEEADQWYNECSEFK